MRHSIGLFFRFSLLALIMWLGYLGFFLSQEHTCIRSLVSYNTPVFLGQNFQEYIPNNAGNCEYYRSMETAFFRFLLVLFQKRNDVTFHTLYTLLEDSQKDFLAISLIESKFDPLAFSGVGAAGIWQIMPDTAGDLGLTVNEAVDERLHTHLATQAAKAYLEDLFERFGNWELALAAYNRGPNAISQAIIHQKTDSFYELTLNSQTSDYIPRIFGAALALRVYYFFFGEPHSSLYLQKITLTQKITLEELAQTCHINASTLAENNPWILQDFLPAGTWDIFLPLTFSCTLGASK